MKNNNIEIQLLRFNLLFRKELSKENNLENLFNKACLLIDRCKYYSNAFVYIKNSNTMFCGNSEITNKDKQAINNCYRNILNNNSIDKSIDIIRKNNHCIKTNTPTIAKSIIDNTDVYGIIVLNIEIAFDNSELHNKIVSNISDSISDEISRINNSASNNNSSFNNTYTTIFEKAPVGISILDKDGYINNVNTKECIMLGYSKEDIIGKHISTFISKNLQKKFKENFTKFLESGGIDVCMDLVNSKGEIIKANRIAKAIKDSSGNIVKIITHTQDISQTHKINKELNILNQAIEHSTSIIVITNLDNRIVYVNKQFTNITGYSYTESLGEVPHILNSGLLKSDTFTKLWSNLNKNKTWKGEFNNKTKNGTTYWERAEISPFYDENGEKVGYIKTAEDITKLKKIETRLKDTNNNYKRIFEITPLPIVIHKNSRIIEINPAALNFMNKGSEHKAEKKYFIGINIFDFIHSSNKENIAARLMKLIKTNLPLPKSQNIFYNNKGEERVIELVSSPIQYNEENAIMSMFEDITDRINWTNKLKESEYKFHSIFDSNPNAISILRRDNGLILDVNPSFSTISNYSNKELIGKTDKELKIYNNIEDRETIISLLEKDGKIDNKEFLFKKKDGELFSGLISGRMIKINKEDCILFVVRDITESKRIQHELFTAKEKAEEHDRLKTAFLANMSHEIRNPMNAIIGFSDLLKDDNLSKKEIDRYIDIIQSKGEDLLVLINDIIDVSKIESGVIEINSKPTSLNKIIHNVGMNYNQIIKKKDGLSLNIIIKHNPIYIYADTTRIHQVFNNLLDNAIKFTNKGDISIEADIVNKEVEITISDSGIGIMPEKLHLIFGRFIQLESKNIIAGSGLGLSITKSLIELMNGKIEVASKYGKGTKFTIKFPLIDPPI